MDARMAAREWFLDKPGSNKYDIEVHVQLSFWHSGFGAAFFQCTKADPPYKCVGFWRGQEIELEWVPRQWLSLSMPAYDESMVEGVSRILRLDPTLRYTVAGSNGHASGGTGQTESEAASHERFVVEWHVRGVEQRFRELLEHTGVREVRLV